MYYFYILKSKKSKAQTYIGYTSDLRQRFERHNQGLSNHYEKELTRSRENVKGFGAKKEEISREWTQVKCR